jgi:dUTP pyrophosphatase
MKVLKIKRINDKARLPQYAHPGDAGFDLYSIESIDINPGDTALVKTRIIIELPEETEAQVRPRSGLALKYQ